MGSVCCSQLLPGLETTSHTADRDATRCCAPQASALTAFTKIYVGGIPPPQVFPLMQGTKGLFDKEMIGRMKKGSYLVNTARGAICDTQAVKEALESGHLRGCEHPCL